MKTSISLLFLFFPILCVAQQQITGLVTDDNNAPLPFANVILNSTDGHLLGGTITSDDGSFIVDYPVNASEIKVFVSYIGFESDTIGVARDDNKELHFTLHENANSLDEVVVTAHRDIFKLQNGSLIANVQNSALSRAPSMEKMLNNVPFVSGRDGAFQVFGRGAAQFYINGRKVLDMSEVDRLQPSQIQTIEVITDPSGKYSSEVNAIIKIQTKGYQNGLGGNVYTDVQIRDYSNVSNTENVALTLNINNWQLGTSIYYNYFDIPSENTSNEIINSQQKYAFSENSEGGRKCPVVSGNFDSNYTFSNGSVVGVSAFLYKYKQTETYTNFQEHTADDVEDYSSQTESENVRKRKHLIANAFYNIQLGRTKISLSDDLMKGTHNVYTEEDYFDAQVTTNMSTDYLMNSFIADFKTALHDFFSLNYGLEYTYSDNNQEFSYTTQNLETDMQPSIYEIKQNLSAGYFTIEADFSKIHLSTGLRYEYSDMQYFIDRNKNEEQSRTYHDFFPYINVQYSGDLLSVSLAYRKSVKRPAYNKLSNALVYASPFEYTSGNAWLKSTYTQKISFLASLGDFSLIGSYDFIKDASNYVLDIYGNSKNVVWSHLSNFEQYEKCSLGVEWERTFSFYTPCVEVDLGKQNFKYAFMNESRKYDSPYFSVDLMQSFKLPYRIALDIDASYNSAQYSMFEKQKKDWFLDVVISKAFDCGLRINCSATDIFNNDFVESETYCNNIEVINKQKLNVPMISISATYSFNALKKRNAQGKKTAEFSRFN